jgi:hypothetical protein
MLQSLFELSQGFFSSLGKHCTHQLTVQTFIWIWNFSDEALKWFTLKIKFEWRSKRNQGSENLRVCSGRKGKDIILVESIQTLDEKALVVNITCLHLRKQRLKVFSAHTHIESPRVSEWAPSSLHLRVWSNFYDNIKRKK